MKVHLLKNCYVNDCLYPGGHEEDWGDAVGNLLIAEGNAVAVEVAAPATPPETKGSNGGPRL